MKTHVGSEELSIAVDAAECDVYTVYIATYIYVVACKGNPGFFIFLLYTQTLLFVSLYIFIAWCNRNEVFIVEINQNISLYAAKYFLDFNHWREEL